MRLLVFDVSFIPILIIQAVRSLHPYCASTFVQPQSPRAAIASVIDDVLLDILEIAT